MTKVSNEKPVAIPSIGGIEQISVENYLNKYGSERLAGYKDALDEFLLRMEDILHYPSPERWQESPAGIKRKLLVFHKEKVILQRHLEETAKAETKPSL